LPPPKSFELLADQRVSCHHKYAVPFFIGDIYHAQIAPIRCLPKRLPGAAGASFIFAGVGQDPFGLGFGHAVLIDVRLVRFRVAVVADFHDRPSLPAAKIIVAHRLAGRQTKRQGKMCRLALSLTFPPPVGEF
jgi:hypothetical protein